MDRNTDKTASIAPCVNVIGKRAPRVTKSKPFKKAGISRNEIMPDYFGREAKKRLTFLQTELYFCHRRYFSHRTIVFS